MKLYQLVQLGRVFSLLGIVALFGCSVKVPELPKVYWPAPPNQPKLEWITTYATEDDFQKTERQIATEQFLGKKQMSYFLKPGGVASVGDGTMYVADMDASELRVIDFNNKTSTSYSKEAPLATPVGLAFDRNDNLYVADAYRKIVVKFNHNKKVVLGYGAGELQRPTFIALDEKRNRLYVSDVVKHEVFVFDLSSGEKLFSFGGQGSGPGDLYVPQGIAIAQNGNVYVAEQLNARVQVFNSEGEHLFMFGKRGDKTFDFEGPRGLAFDSEGNLYVAETRKSSVLIFSADGDPLTYLGGATSSHPLGFAMPSSLYVDRNDRIYIADVLNRRVTVWQYLTSAYLSKNPLDQEQLKKIEKRVLQLQE